MLCYPITDAAQPEDTSHYDRNVSTGASQPIPSRVVEETSAGGLVIDSTSRSRGLLIARADRHGALLWSLPKGHVEAGETLSETAIREVREETGIVGRVIAPLGPIDYWFAAHGRRIHKTVHHFLLVAEGGQLSDTDIEVTAVAWVPLDTIPGRLAYSDERQLVARVPDILAGRGRAG